MLGRSAHTPPTRYSIVSKMSWIVYWLVGLLFEHTYMYTYLYTVDRVWEETLV